VPKPRKRKQANPFEQMMGLHGATTAHTGDMFTNAAARQGFGTPSLGQGAEYTLVRLSYDYWQLITLYRNHWISRRIVEVPAQDMVKAWPKLTSELEPKDLDRVDRAIRKTNTKNNVLTGLTWGRLFGGAGGLIVIKGQENELDQPLDLDSVGIGAYKGVIPFDRWAGISPSGDVCTDIERPLDFNKPEMYEVRVTGGDSFQVHASRLLRFLGPSVPTPEYEAQSTWGISVLEPTYESITMLDNTMWNILGLTFRANLLGMKFPELAQLLSGLGSSQLASQKFEQRMSAVNHLMSNQSLIPLPADGGIESTQYNFGGLEGVFQLFQLNLAGAAQMPVTRLFGRTYTGLGQAGDGDERIYEEKIATDQSTYLAPQLEKLYPVICMSELGEVPDDLDLDFPSIRVLDEKEKSELAKTTADTLTVYLNGGIMSPRTVGKEVKQSSDFTGIGSNMDAEALDKLSDDIQSEGELGEGLFGGEGAGLNEAGSPAKAIKGENEESKEKQDEPKAKDELLADAGRAVDSAPAMDALPSGLAEGERVLVNGKLLTVHKVVEGTVDLFGEPTVQVMFRTGEVVAYRPSQDVKVRAEDDKPTTLDKSGERCGKPQWRTCPACNGRVHQSTCGVKLHHDRDCVKERGCPYSLLSHGQSTRSFGESRATDEDGASSFTRSCEDMMVYHALPVRIENLAGAPRGGLTPAGEHWSINMAADYGFIEGIVGADGDSLDCYVGPSPESNNVYVVDQLVLGEPDKFDEHKVFFGYHTREAALEDYAVCHHKAADVFGAMTEFTMPTFRKWMRTHDMSKPCGALEPGT
jgi:phage-related protein (TIGR01555 family)